MTLRCTLTMLLWCCSAGLAHAAAPSEMSADDARHLLLRTGFAPTQAEVDAVAGRDARRVVSQLVALARNSTALQPAPAIVGAPPATAFRLLRGNFETLAFIKG